MTHRRGVAAFVVERCLPVYPVLLTLWVCAVESMTTVLNGSVGPWRPSWDTALKVLALMAAGVFLRMVDDQKDLDYDRFHHPTRPLVQGRVTSRQLRTAMVPTAAVALVIAAAVSPWAFALLACALAYSLALWWAESRVGVLRDNAMANLAAVCPIQFLVTGLSMTAQPGVGEAPWWRLAAVPLVFTSAFLHAEIARKTSRSAVVEGGAGDRHSYSELIGPTASALTACFFGVVAVVVELLLTMPWSWTWSWTTLWWPAAWLPALTAALPLVSARAFLRGREIHPQALPPIFVAAFFVSVIVQGLVF